MVWIVLAIAVVAVVIGAVVIFRKQMAGAGEVRTPSLEGRPGRGAEGAADRAAEESRAGAAEAVEESKPADREAAAAAKPVPEPPPPKPEPTPEEVRAEVEGLLAESDRILGELKELMGGGEDETADGTVEVLIEGLQEVRSLASRDQWAQAKEKGEALKSQLVMMLRSTRREQES